MDEAFDPKMKEHYFVDSTHINNLILSGEPAIEICKNNGYNLSELSPL